MERKDNRRSDELRPVSMTCGVSPYAEGSCEVCFGNTRVLATATVETKVPEWLRERGQGWITAEYGMLPRATGSRNSREAVGGRQSARTQEIQRLIGRSLRQAVKLDLLGPITIRVDCDVIVADGGTRTAAISGGWVALAQAVQWAKGRGLVPHTVELSPVAAVSVGMVDGVPLLDLCYEEDSQADFDLNLVFNERSELIEIQGTAERQTVSVTQLPKLLEVGLFGITEILEIQRRAVNHGTLSSHIQ